MTPAAAKEKLTPTSPTRTLTRSSKPTSVPTRASTPGLGPSHTAVPTNLPEPTPSSTRTTIAQANAATTQTPKPTTTPAPTQASAGGHGGSSRSKAQPTTSPTPAKAAFVPRPPGPPSAGVSSAPAAEPAAAAADSSALSVSPAFLAGFALLKGQLGDQMGDPLEFEHGDSSECDTQQLTTTGLAYWRCSTNLTSFVALPEGLQHWASTPAGLLAWNGEDVDPPRDAALVASAGPSGVDGRIFAACVGSSEGVSPPCTLGDGATVLGYLRASGMTDTYRFSLTSPATQVLATLTDLPADYDLYLADATGGVLAESVQEGSAPEQVQVTADAGAYYLYVHVDAARAVDPDNPYRLQLSLSSAVATTPVVLSPDTPELADAQPSSPAAAQP